MNEDMMTEAERASIAADGTDGLLGKRGKGVFHIHTLGCQMNVHDSERIAGVLEANGYVPATEDQINDNDLDLLVLNTCAVRENAAERMYGTIGRFNRVKLVRPNLQIAVGGCMAQLDRKKIADTAPWVSAVFGTKNIEDLPKLLDQNRATGKAQVQVTEQLRQFPSQLPAARASRISSWVAISVGCNNTCTFCIVPTTRGKEKDRRPGDILDEIRQCVADGAKEVTLLGQNVNSYGRGLDENVDFAELLRKVNAIPGDFRIRFMTSHPKDATERLFAAMAECEKCAPHIHLPVQSGSDRILRAMNRGYTAEKYLAQVDLARKYIPNLVLTTDVIVGFPGETEEDFLDTLALTEKVRFDSMFTFIYSRRPGTPAAKIEDDTPRSVIQNRFDRLVESAGRVSAELHRAQEGKTFRVLIDGTAKNGDYTLSARTAGGRLVHLRGDESLIGSWANARIVSSNTFALFGEITE